MHSATHLVHGFVHLSLNDCFKGDSEMMSCSWWRMMGSTTSQVKLLSDARCFLRVMRNRLPCISEAVQEKKAVPSTAMVPPDLVHPATKSFASRSNRIGLGFASY